MPPYLWKRNEKDIEISSIKELLDILVNIPIENIDQEIQKNIIKGTLIKWIETNFPKKLILITQLKKAIEEYTPQQLREMLIRELNQAKK